ncbi:MAG: type II toxin-antitoxin system RelE/ParE family toxin [Bergeyella sp.]
MKTELTTECRQKLKRQIQYISLDKPIAAKRFNKLVFSEIKKIKEVPFKNKKSKFFDDENIRELIIKGYSIIYEVNKSENMIVVFGFHKWEDSLNL